MALLQKFKYVQSEDCATIAITDITGNYDVTTNPEGYGVPNDARNVLYSQIYVTYKGTINQELTINYPSVTENRLNDLAWSVDVTKDGWYEIWLFYSKIWQTANYNINNIVYRPSNNTYYKALVNTVITVESDLDNTTNWLLITSLEEFVDYIEYSNIYYYKTDLLSTCRLEKCKNNLLIEAACCDCVDDCFLKDYEKVWMKIQGAKALYMTNNLTKAQEIIESAERICASCKPCNCK